MLAPIKMVSIWIPRNVRRVVGPSTFDSLIGALILLRSVSITWRFVAQVFESAGLAVKFFVQLASCGPL